MNNTILLKDKMSGLLYGIIGIIVVGVIIVIFFMFCKKKEPERKSWQEISESAEYQAMSEHDRLLARWAYFKGTPEYEALTTYDKIAVQKEFCRLLDEAGKRQSADTRQAGCVITVPIYDDGLDDDDDEIKL